MPGVALPLENVCDAKQVRPRCARRLDRGILRWLIGNRLEVACLPHLNDCLRTAARTVPSSCLDVLNHFLTMSKTRPDCYRSFGHSERYPCPQNYGLKCGLENLAKWTSQYLYQQHAKFTSRPCQPFGHLYFEQLVVPCPNAQALLNTCKTARLRAGIRAGAAVLTARVRLGRVPVLDSGPPKRRATDLFTCISHSTGNQAAVSGRVVAEGTALVTNFLHRGSMEH